MFELVPKLGYSGTARYLNKQGILTKSRYQTEVLKLKPLNKKSAEKWNADKILSIISDYEYCGHIVNLVKRKDGQIILKDRRPRIVSEEEYELANRKRLDNKKKLESRKNKLNFIYDSSGKKLFYCNCKGKFVYQAKGFQVCEKTLIKMLYGDAISTLKEIQKNSPKFYQTLERRITINSCKIPKQELEKKLKQLDGEYASLLEKYFMQKVTIKYFESKSKEINDKMNSIKELLNQNVNIKSQLVLLERKFNMFLESLEDIPQDEIELIRMMIEKVVISKIAKNQYDVKIKYKFEP